MKQREVTDKENTRWACVQAYSMSDAKVAEKATELTDNARGKVTVVCTPTGGAQTVRLQLDENWEEKMTDESLVEAISDGV